MTRRHRQHVRRVRYPERASTAHLLLGVAISERISPHNPSSRAKCQSGSDSRDPGALPDSFRLGMESLASPTSSAALQPRLALGMTSVAEFHTIFFVNTSSVPRRRKI